MVDRKTINIFELGHRNPVTEKDQIIWFWTQRAKSYKQKNHQTRYWLDLREIYEPHLKKMEAFELLAFLIEKASDKKMVIRMKHRLLQSVENLLFDARIDEWHKHIRQ